MGAGWSVTEAQESNTMGKALKGAAERLLKTDTVVRDLLLSELGRLFGIPGAPPQGETYRRVGVSAFHRPRCCPVPTPHSTSPSFVLTALLPPTPSSIRSSEFNPSMTRTSADLTKR
jgi:hypothetical protein